MPVEFQNYEKFSIAIYFQGDPRNSYLLYTDCTNAEFLPIGIRFLDSQGKTHIIGGHHFSFHISQNESAPNPSDLVLPAQELILPIR